MSAYFKLIGGENAPATDSLGKMLQGIGHDLRDVEATAAGVSVVTVPVLTAPSYTTQLPVGLDAPIQLEFGDAQAIGTGIDVDALGAFTCTVTDEYNFRVLLQFGRVGQPTIAALFARFLINGFQAGSPVYTFIDDSADRIPTTFEATTTLQAGDVLTVEIVRDSQGSDAGGVFAATSSIGWGTAPSCLMTIIRTVIAETPTT
jgi:hypothetical protein